ncbi:P-loop containing nucleoside triphosphate hydrolase protein [Baffinella frigidus]|nr:P-loop containing nucleoside triphosphate hydrolase protein [Cryptophyta sp. CCMP2293]
MIQYLYEPTQGAVFLDSQDIRSLDVDWLRENVTVVHETPVLFNMSIAQNIAYAIDTASQAQVEAAARLAGAHDFIQTFPDGYQALVGDTGVRLTASQKLQVAIARALLVESKVLVLDEALAGLDDATASKILQGLRSEASPRTIIACTSQPSSLRGHADRIVVLEDGKVVEQGVHDELAAKGGVYAGLLQGGDGGRGAGGRGEAEWRRRLSLADAVEEEIMGLSVSQETVMELVEMANEMKEAILLEFQAA